MKTKHFATALLLAVLLIGCEYNDDLSSSNGGVDDNGTVVSASVTGIRDGTLEFYLDNQTYQIRENGVFSTDEIPAGYTVSLDEYTNGGEFTDLCFLFDNVDINSSLDHIVECYPNEVGFSEKSVGFGAYHFAIGVSQRVLYSSEHSLIDVNESAPEDNITIETYTKLKGLFFDDWIHGDWSYYTLEEARLPGGDSIYTLHDQVRALLTYEPYVNAVDDLYVFDSYPLVSKEYLVTLTGPRRPMQVARYIAASLRAALGADPLGALPHVDPEATASGQMTIMVALFGYDSAGRVLYSIGVTSGELAASGQHFPTPRFK
ncbi:hypothetical protein ACXWTF_12615 [Thiomicrolovo sp. ZZH C-3]